MVPRLEAGGKPRAAAAAEAAFDDGFDDFPGWRLVQSLVQREVSVGGDVAVDPVGVDDAAVGEDDGELFAEEGGVGVASGDVVGLLLAVDGGDDGGCALRGVTLM